MSRIYFALAAALLLPAVAFAGATASSELKDSWGEAGKMAANAVCDNDPATGWVEGNEGDGVGEWIQLDLPRGTLLSFTVQPGMGPDDAEFQRYARPQQIDIDIFSLDDMQQPKQVKQVTHTFEDAFGPVTIEVGELAVGEELWGGKAKITIRSIYPGTDFDTLVAISEIRATVKEMDIETIVAIENSTGDASKAVDKRDNTPWIAEGGAEEWITVEAPDWSISSLGILPGNASSSSNYSAYSRPKVIEVRVNMDTYTIELADKKETQWFELPISGGYNGSCYGEVRLQVKEVYPGTSHPEVAISEVRLRAINYGG